MNAPVLEVRELTVGYGPVTAVDNISFDVMAGSMVTLIGANGAGKTTLLKALMGALPVRSGTVCLDGVDLGHAPIEERVRRGMYLVPEKRALFASMKVEDNLRLGAFAKRRKLDVNHELERIFSLFPVLKERREQQAGTLSGGEQQMVAIGRALIAQPRVLLLDEPSIGLAPRIVQQIMEVIVELKRKEKLTVILVEQNARLALRAADEGYLVEVGRVVKRGTGSELANDPALVQSYLGIAV
ncbi:ABC transporter ATP-binding protein [Bordetella avium]|uniref:ABC transporter ATP-binding protein n=1 Tax=Bordetella avium TaxID=521 RepID=UPI000E0A415D|nr:ABC transporter ATP-binding protein [Bordetella avium]AZY48749.1 ABC transporter ATP-binding protein [Bordetella avium]AZY52128.1 ABC transporter ATP-binding protein [Bordetella avium]RIQ14055.1 ATP-binding cassette domain-containing protein [Bordetella avium]RIQ17928.1 ATP-binding cassette domain-containing protein [Bordetella avium]RIQ36404.1 ATP-binding cassette domain-containing protein [Bordetella avium]